MSRAETLGGGFLECAAPWRVQEGVPSLARAGPGPVTEPPSTALTMKPKFLIFVVILAGAIAWTQFPNFRAKAKGLANQYGGWTEQAIKDDPAGYIEYAQKQLEANIKTFEASRTALSESRTTAETKLNDFKKALDGADALAATLKSQFQAAKASGSFPIEVAGRKLSEADTVRQVEQLLAEKSNAQKRIEDYTKILAAVETKRSQLTDRISQSRAKVDELIAQAAMVKLDKLTGEADKLLAQVNEVVIDNGKLAAGETSGDPVRSLAEMMQDIEKLAAEAPKAAAESDAMAFLNN